MSEPVLGINPQMLTWARERSGHTVMTAAAALRQPDSVVQDWETGAASPTYPQLEKLAYNVYKRPIALFFFPSPPEEPDPEKAFRTLPETEVEDLLPDTRHKIREGQAFQLSLSELAYGRNPSARNILQDLAFTPTVSPEKAAEEVRAYLGITFNSQTVQWKNSEEALRAWRSVLEEVGIFVFKASFKQRDVSGFALYDPVFPIIMVNNSTAKTRQIFTLFHELAHLLLHENGVTKADDRFVGRLNGMPRHIEVFCNRFAADFLLPKEHVKQLVSQVGVSEVAISGIAKRFKVSREVVLRRLLDMEYVTQDAYDTLVERWASEREAGEVGGSGGNYYLTQASYLSPHYTQLAFAGFYRGTYPVERLADYLNIKVSSIPGLEQVVLQRVSS